MAVFLYGKVGLFYVQLLCTKIQLYFCTNCFGVVFAVLGQIGDTAFLFAINVVINCNMYLVKCNFRHFVNNIIDIGLQKVKISAFIFYLQNF